MSPIERKGVKKGSMTMYLLLLVLTLLSMVALKNCDRFMEHQPNKPVQELVVAMEYAPLSCYTYDDTLGGFSYDLLRMVARYAGLKPVYQPMVTLSTSLEQLKNGSYRMVCAEFPVTKETKQEYLFTNPIYIDRQVLVQRKQDDGSVAVKSLLDLAQDTVWVVDGSSIQTRLSNLSREIGDTIYVKTDKEYGAEQLFMRVASGEIKQAVMNEGVASVLAKRYPDVDISTAISFSQFQSWVLRKGDEAFCDSINSWLEAVKATPEYRILYNRYFPK